MGADDMAMFSHQGLNDDVAAERLRIHGPNALPSPEARSMFNIAFNIIREPMMLLLLAAGLTYLVLGDRGEAIVLLLLASVSVVITVVQETRTERVLDALRDLTSPRALVIRNGIRKRIAGRDVVPGDVMVLEEGGRVPADGALFYAHDLLADESLLTGESLPVRKTAEAEEVFSGTLIVRGKGLAVVTATGQ
jgi:P-type Ca2+ transporter type 2C